MNTYINNIKHEINIKEGEKDYKRTLSIFYYDPFLEGMCESKFNYIIYDSPYLCRLLKRDIYKFYKQESGGMLKEYLFNDNHLTIIYESNPEFNQSCYIPYKLLTYIIQEILYDYVNFETSKKKRIENNLKLNNYYEIKTGDN